MRPKSLILLALAGGCGIVASIGISQVLDSKGRGPAQIESRPIYVALHNINLGDPIDATMVSLQEWPKDKIPPGAISQLEDLEGRRPRAAIIQGEPLLEPKLLAPGAISDPIASIPAEMRLVTVSVDAEKSAAGLLSPGDRVDVQLFVKRNPASGIDEPKTKVILQNIRVYAVDQLVQRAAEGGDQRAVAKTISLLLTPEQAGKVSLAEKVGEISLIPRNPDDDSDASVGEITLADLLGDDERNTREKEQGREEGELDGNGGGLLSALRFANDQPPFRMEIVMADVVTEQFFNPETGKPLRAQAPNPRQRLMPGASRPGGLGPATNTSSPPPSGEDSAAGEMELEEFPIDLSEIE